MLEPGDDCDRLFHHRHLFRAGSDFGCGRRGVSAGGRGTRYGGLGQRLTAGRDVVSYLSQTGSHALPFRSSACGKRRLSTIEFHVAAHRLGALVVGGKSELGRYDACRVLAVEIIMNHMTTLDSDPMRILIVDDSAASRNLLHA